MCSKTELFKISLYRKRVVPQLKAIDQPNVCISKRLRIVRSAEDGEFDRKIIISDEAHLYLGGYINKQNSPVWGIKNKYVVLKKPMHPCAMFCAQFSLAASSAMKKKPA